MHTQHRHCTQYYPSPYPYQTLNNLTSGSQERPSSCISINGQSVFRLALFLIMSAGLLTGLSFGVTAQSASAESADAPASPSEMYAMLSVMGIPSTLESVPIRASGLWRNGCTPQYSHHVITGASVQIVAVAEPAEAVCTQAETEWAFDIDIDIRTPDLYDVEVIVLSEWDQGQQLHTSISMWVLGSVTHLPTAPHSDDEIIIVIDGVHAHGCTPSYQSHQTDEQTIVIDAAEPGPDMVCGQAISPWTITVELGTLDPDVYAVEFYITSYTSGEPIREMYQRSEMSVTSPRNLQQHLFYLPGLILQ